VALANRGASKAPLVAEVLGNPVCSVPPKAKWVVVGPAVSLAAGNGAAAAPVATKLKGLLSKEKLSGATAGVFDKVL
jgi:hypothetical protein